MRSQNINAHEDRERQVRDDEQGVRQFDTSQQKRYIDLHLNFSAGATDTNDIRRRFLERLDGRLAGKFRIQRGAQHRES